MLRTGMISGSPLFLVWAAEGAAAFGSRDKESGAPARLVGRGGVSHRFNSVLNTWLVVWVLVAYIQLPVWLKFDDLTCGTSLEKNN
ncbi:hypothetical protein HPP92_012248 [Vanilla planifolia]|uniref:Uncharacterized protein n=1 Tax=Vanilla planifolia TaxID=51239 RepID=A0A835V2K3_VANPL|nr:hypothetical protein HPP92_012248 [Vanilla planifolia]